MQQLKEKLKGLLRRLGLFECARSAYTALWALLHGTARKRRRAFFRGFDQFVTAVNGCTASKQSPTVIFFGYLLDSRKPLLFHLAREISARDNADVLLCTNNSPRAGDAAPEDLLNSFDPDKVLRLPIRSAAASRLKLTVTSEMQALYEEKPYLKDALINARASFPQASKGHVEVLICQYYRCFEALLDKFNVSGVVIWNAFKYHHMIFAAMCKERNIKLMFAEFGAIPGTVVFDEGGQMGESWPATHPEEFNALPVSEEDCTEAARLIAALRQSGLNRNAQQDGLALDDLTVRLKPDRPTLLFAGQCDRDSGIIPYNETARRFHSPSFPSTVDAVIHAAKIAAANDWNLIFRPHPIAKQEAYDPRLPKNVIVFTEGSINDIIDLSDVVVTTLSSTVYVSLIRETPCVMLGYNQIHGKGCAYEALDKDSIEAVLQQAVHDGYTEAQKAAFIRHVAQMGKYYLFSDGRQSSGPSFGRSARDAAKLVESLLPES